MKKILQIAIAALVCLLFCATLSQAQISFSNSNNRLNNTSVAHFNSGVTITISDMNGDGLDDIVRLSQGHDCYIEYQQPGDQFRSVHIGNFSNSSQWGMVVADVDHNGYKDVLAGGGGIKLMKLDSAGLMGSIVTIPTSAISNFLLQNANFMDVNNDGWEDIFACDDNNPSHIWLNDGTGNFNLSNIIDFNIHNYSIGGDPADAGNYGSVWTDFDNDGDVDLYIAKCRQGVASIADPRRIDVLFVNNGNGSFTQMDTAYGVADSLESWTSSFGDIDNDGDMDFLLTEQNGISRIMENDGSGHYTDITSTTGFSLSVQPIQSVLEDFDNDGYLDIMVTGASSQLFHNNGNKTFTEVLAPFDNNDMESFAVGDLNHDGKIDIYGGYASIYTTPTSVDDVVWMNTTNNQNNFITLRLTGTVTNKGALGSRAEVYSNGMKQIREVRAGESYGTCNTSDLHFGLSTATVIDSILIRWAAPSTNVTIIISPSVNQFLSVVEGDCVSENNVINYGGSVLLCPGQLAQLDAVTGSSYLWSTGETTQSISVSATGEYNVMVHFAGNDCFSTSASKSITMNPDETPVITANSDLTFCQGGSVTLQSSPALAYTWSTGSTTSSTVVTQSGIYSLTVQGLCQTWNATPVGVNVHPAPAPIASDVTLPGPGSANLSATGNNIHWYDALTGGNLVGSGPTYTTPVLSSDAIYYAEDSYLYGQQMYSTGLPYSSGMFSGNTINSSTIFDVLHPCILRSVKVYTDTPGDRTIELSDNNNTVLQSITVTIPMDSSIVNLNFNLANGISYHLGTNSAQNNTSFGYASPRLERNNAGVVYPYVISHYISINGSTQSNTAYYYFYDWKVEDPGTTCISERTPVQVLISVGIPALGNDQNVRLFPNPANGIVNIQFSESFGINTTLELTDMTGRIVHVEKAGNILKGQMMQVNVVNLASGTYIMNIRNSDHSFRQQISITN